MSDGIFGTFFQLFSFFLGQNHPIVRNCPLGLPDDRWRHFRRRHDSHELLPGESFDEKSRIATGLAYTV